MEPDGGGVIKAVLFDLDGTLLDRTNSLVAFLAGQHARFAYRLGETNLETWRSRFLGLDQNGHVHKSVVCKAILSEFGGDAGTGADLFEDYQHGSCKHARGFPGMTQTLSALRLHGLKLGIVTNGEPVFQMKNIKALGLEALVDVILISEAEGLRKPDAALFLRAAERLTVRPDQCLFVGDNAEADILGAHGAGMKTAWFNQSAIWPGSHAPNPGAEIRDLPQTLALV
jgi:putative hydrolase of the HAD superfamily